ncbi:hypothetical protein BDV96DRAFT_647833 [Lophiotrema nucula]|uniref:Uncharacterized protein n=1 Tax=Lophiotrema nucula TaxID=690887 RepID=A0A6A5Z3V5_9PLEO|nr:hypothetical protein BDV96DRAFT_647833 [Lophiotrema nucula]
MVDVAVSAQLQQWTFEKTTLVRPERSDSSASSSPDLYHNDSETLRIDTAAVEDTQDLDTKENISFQDRYLSSEEDLSPMEADSEFEYDDDVSIHEVVQQTFSARKMSISRIEKGKSFDLAVMVSYVSAGRPKMINLANVGSPVREAQRSASLAQLPIAAIKKLRDADQATRRSFVGPTSSSSTSRSNSPASNVRRPSTGNLPLPHNNSSLKLSDSSSSFVETASSRSSSPSASENSSRPATSAAAPALTASRSSLYIVTTANSNAQREPFPPLTPLSPEQHSFLSSDPYENNTTSAASPIIKSGPHKRLRSISMKLSLAKIAITPSTKKWDSRINGRSGTMPPTPATPYTPVTPMTAPPTTFSSPKNNKLRRSSRSSRPTSMRGDSSEIPPVPTRNPNPSPRKSMQRMVPRGADERAPIIELPPCPTDQREDVDPMGSIKSKRIRKRKSLMDLL